jgi:hypothetical protein
MPEAIRSIPECAASLNMPSDPLSTPVSSFSSVIASAASTDDSAADRLAAPLLRSAHCAIHGPEHTSRAKLTAR